MDERELQETAEKAREPFEKKVGATMAIIAAALALVSVYGHITTTEELLNQQRASNQWAYYQSKAIRRYQSEFARDMMSAMNSPAAAEAGKKYGENADRYQKESTRIEDQAREYERESAIKGRQALRLHVGEIFLEIAIVFSSLALLTRRGFFWTVGVVSAVVGGSVSATVFWILR